MSTSGRSYVQRVPASVAARLAGVRAVSSFLLPRWFRSYLSSRCFRVKCNNDFSSPHTCLCGVPQGSVFGPLLFVMYTTSLNTLVSSLSLNRHLYAVTHNFSSPSIHQIFTSISVTKCSTTDLFLDDCQSSHSQLF